MMMEEVERPKDTSSIPQILDTYEDVWAYGMLSRQVRKETHLLMQLGGAHSVSAFNGNIYVTRAGSFCTNVSGYGFHSPATASTVATLTLKLLLAVSAGSNRLGTLLKISQLSDTATVQTLVCLFSSVSIVSDSLGPHGLHHARLPCPSPIPRVYSNSCPLSQ